MRFVYRFHFDRQHIPRSDYIPFKKFFGNDMIGGNSRFLCRLIYRYLLRFPGSPNARIDFRNMAAPIRIQYLKTRDICIKRMSYRKSPDNSFSYSLVGVEGFELSEQTPYHPEMYIQQYAIIFCRKQSIIIKLMLCLRLFALL